MLWFICTKQEDVNNLLIINNQSQIYYIIECLINPYYVFIDVFVLNTDIHSKVWISGLIISGSNVWGRKRNIKNSLSPFSLNYH